MKPKIEQEQELNFVNNFWKSDAKKETMQPKSIDRNLVIKCATPQEQELVKQWLIDNGESVAANYTTGNIAYPFVEFVSGISWNNVVHPDYRLKKVTPPELGIIPPIEEFKNGDVVDALLRDVWVSDCRYIGKDTFQKGSIVVGLGEDIRICMEVRKPLKTVTMQQVADKFGYELGTFKIEN